LAADEQWLSNLISERMIALQHPSWWGEVTEEDQVEA